MRACQGSRQRRAHKSLTTNGSLEQLCVERAVSAPVKCRCSEELVGCSQTNNKPKQKHRNKPPGCAVLQPGAAVGAADFEGKSPNRVQDSRPAEAGLKGKVLVLLSRFLVQIRLGLCPPGLTGFTGSLLLAQQ